MPKIDIEHLKSGLLPVQQAKAAWEDAVKARGAATSGDLPAAREAADKAFKAYTDACVQLYGYVEGAVKGVEARASTKR